MSSRIENFIDHLKKLNGSPGMITVKVPTIISFASYLEIYILIQIEW